MAVQEKSYIIEKDGKIYIKEKVTNRKGLHARPCSLIAQIARECPMEIEMDLYGEVADAKDILDLLSKAAGYGSEPEFRLKKNCKEATKKDYKKGINALEKIHGLFTDDTFKQFKD